MSGVTNNTERQYNIKAINKGRLTVVRLKPGFNVVPDGIWAKVAGSDYVKMLKKEKMIDFGKVHDDKELEVDDSKNAATKETKVPVKNKSKEKK